MILSSSEVNRKIKRCDTREDINVGNFKFSEEYRTITFDNESFHLREKLYFIFLFLIHSNGKLIRRDLIIDSIWPNNMAVGQKSLTRAIYDIRKILSHDNKGRVQIITHSKVGYQLLIRASE